jgi:thioredoxin 1
MDIEKQIKETPLLLVDFYAQWCGPCIGMMPTLEQLQEDLGDSLQILKVDIDQHPTSVTDYNVMGVPTFVLYRDGQKVWQKPGTFSLQQLKEMIGG